MQNIIGIDEVGRGCWAGPLLVAAARAIAVLPDGLRDSKLLTPYKRQDMMDDIVASCRLGEGWVEPFEIDELGLGAAMRLGVERALQSLNAQPDEAIILDGHINYCPPTYTNVQCVVRADNLHPIVSAASIYAKVRRDQHMAALAVQYPQYGFETHVGYGTKRHLDALKQFGVSPLHRLSYKPIKAFL